MTYQRKVFPSGRVSEGFKEESLVEILIDYDPFLHCTWQLPLCDVYHDVNAYMCEQEQAVGRYNTISGPK